MDAPAVSVVLAVHNGMPFLPDAVESVLRGQWRDLELVVVDDASTDKSSAYLRDLCDSRVHVLRQDARQGLTASLNHGLSQASGRWIARLDADDAWLPERLALQMACVADRPDVVLVGGGHAEVFGACLPDDVPHPTQLQWEEVSFDELLERNRFCHSSALFRTEVHGRPVRYREAFRMSQDYDLWLRLALCGAVLRVDAPVCLYRRRTEALSLARAYEQVSYAYQARELARERARRGTDRLHERGELPEVPLERNGALRREACNMQLHFAGRSLQHGLVTVAARLAARAFAHAPVAAGREFVLLLIGDQFARRVRRLFGQESSKERHPCLPPRP